MESRAVCRRVASMWRWSRRGRSHARVVVGCLVLLTLGVAWGGTIAPPSRAETAAFEQPDGGIVTVSQTEDLIYQAVDLSWSGFRPTQVLSPDFPLFDLNRVWLMQCRGAEPRRQDCLFGGAPFTQGVRGDGAGGYIPFLDRDGDEAVVSELGASNEQFATTDEAGNGRAQFEVRTDAVFPILGCDSATDPSGAPLPTCSIVVVPSYDANNTEPLTDANWRHRVTIPLAFAPSSDGCEIRNPDAVFEGAPAVQRLFESWQGKLCAQSDRVDAVYVSGGETGARSSFQAGVADSALTTRPFEGAPPRAGTYAPLAVSGLGVGFLVDDQFTGQPLGSLRLNARIVAKVVTQSYGIMSDNPATSGNPLYFGADPELAALNPDLTEGTLLALQTPIMLSGDSDLTYELTRWLDSDPEARAFLDGEQDPYGMEVSSFYRGIDLPVTQLDLRDDFTAVVPPDCEYLPVQDSYPLASLAQAARTVVTASTLVRLPPAPDQQTGDCVQGRGPDGFPGRRAALGMMDTATATALRIPMAELRNSKGRFVAPDRVSMAAALATMTVNPDGVTRQVDHAALPGNGYPLTTVTTAVIPTTGLATGVDGQAERMARVLDLAASTGQLYGVLPGDLPEGYVSLPEDLRALTAAAAQAVRAQNGATETGAPTPTPSAGVPSGVAGSPGGGLGGTASGSATGAPAPAGGAADATGAEAVAAALPAEGPLAGAEPAAQHRGARTVASVLRWVLPGLVLVALVAGVVGPGLLQLGTPGSRTNRVIAGVRRRLGRSAPT